jgi:hypothetical protein
MMSLLLLPRVPLALFYPISNLHRWHDHQFRTINLKETFPLHRRPSWKHAFHVGNIYICLQSHIVGADIIYILNFLRQVGGTVYVWRSRTSTQHTVARTQSHRRSIYTVQNSSGDSNTIKQIYHAGIWLNYCTFCRNFNSLPGNDVAPRIRGGLCRVLAALGPLVWSAYTCTVHVQFRWQDLAPSPG